MGAAQQKDLDAATVVLRTTLGFAHKLTIDTFEKLSEKILNVGIDNQEILDALFLISYEKPLINLRLHPCRTCREATQYGESDPEEREQIGEEDYRIAKVKRRSLGNTRFIGELYMTHNKIISSNVIRNCISNLIRPDDNDPDEEELESLCKLMTTVGEST
ncbi:hypothetical protein BASA83_005760 [Batrachochytrium salamandrivorans]|nr:hypothetical protein BASA83_005760 [Batrachochytrium salamandrivorans]